MSLKEGFGESCSSQRLGGVQFMLKMKHEKCAGGDSAGCDTCSASSAFWRVRSCIIHVFWFAIISPAPAGVVCFLSPVCTDQTMCLFQPAVFNPGQLPSHPAVFTACQKSLKWGIKLKLKEPTRVSSACLAMC